MTLAPGGPESEHWRARHRPVLVVFAVGRAGQSQLLVAVHVAVLWPHPPCWVESVAEAEGSTGSTGPDCPRGPSGRGCSPWAEVPTLTRGMVCQGPSPTDWRRSKVGKERGPEVQWEEA